MRITHIAYDEHENKYYIRFAGEPFYATVEKMKALGKSRARFDPNYTWPDGKEKAWYVDADALEGMTDTFYNLRWQMEQAREKYTQDPLWENLSDMWADELEKEAEQAKERARQAEEEARKRREEQMRREWERIRQERARQSYTYTPARVEDALKVLGLSQPVTKDEVKVAYRKLMLLHHPDKHALASPDVRKQHEQECKKINAANDVVLQWLVVHA